MKAPKRPHILYVEDDQVSCQMMTVLLEMSDIDVSCAHSKSSALELSNNKEFDLFLIDSWLKDGDGNDLCRDLRKEFPATPVVFYTGCATLPQRKQGMLSGAAAYLVKPYSELVAPLVLKLINGSDTINVCVPPPGTLDVLEQKVTKLVHIISQAGRPIPLSP